MARDDHDVRRWLLLGLVFSTTAAATARLLAVFRTDEVSLLEVALLAVFAVLFSWIATSFWTGCLGAYALWRGETASPLSVKPSAVADPSSSRTVLAVPIHNEDCEAVFARLQAMFDSLCEAGIVAGFDFFVLSDTTDPSCHAREQAAWRRFRMHNPAARAYYRRRERNTGHKSGNIAEFCTNWGGHYDYMVVLDADSLMSAAALARMVHLMDANPRVALIQAPPLLVGGQSLFARSQQFASWAYGRLYTAGLAKLHGADGNYWGHNAIIRIRPFMENCGLPILSGRPPLGGEILSHDFVEAALLRRAGWEVWMANDIAGSFEASPPNIIEHLKRDRRWCQGNLQHLRLLPARGLRLSSRLHFIFGALSYLSSPLWLLLVILFSLNAIALEHAAPVTYVGRYPILAWPISHTVAFVTIAVAAMGLLFGPKILSLALILRDPRAVQSFGGRARVVSSFLTESLLSTLLAPIYMLSHTWFVLNILVGRSARWGSQLRGGDGVGLMQSARAFYPHTMVAIAAGLAAWHWTPADFWWYTPLLLGLVLSIPLCWLTSSRSWGARAESRGLFLVHSETRGIVLVDRFESLLASANVAPAVGHARSDRKALEAA